MSLLGLDEAQARLLALATPVDPEEQPLATAAGRWAAADVIARRTQPATALSAMDGYAVRFAELPGPWQVVGENAAGRGVVRALAPGESARIFTGAPLPEGSDTVLIQEDATRQADMVRLSGARPDRMGHHVRPAGSDFQEGAPLILAGERITAARIALAASGGHALLRVRRPIRVTILSTGDELVPPGAPTPDARLPASNGPMLAAMLAGLPVDIDADGILPDRLDILADAFGAAAEWSDILVTTGGASVGDHDLVRPALKAAGATLDFWKVALKPGKPLMAGMLGRTIVLGLPGNPVSAYVTATLFLKPLIARLSGASQPIPPRRYAPVSVDLPAAGGRTEFLRARTVDGSVVPVSEQGSAALAGLARADALIVRTAGAPAIVAGALVEIIDLD